MNVDSLSLPGEDELHAFSAIDPSKSHKYYDGQIFGEPGLNRKAFIEGFGIISRFLTSYDMNECVDDLVATKTKYLHTPEMIQRMAKKK